MCMYNGNKIGYNRLSNAHHDVSAWLADAIGHHGGLDLCFGLC